MWKTDVLLEKIDKYKLLIEQITLLWSDIYWMLTELTKEEDYKLTLISEWLFEKDCIWNLPTILHNNIADIVDNKMWSNNNNEY